MNSDQCTTSPYQPVDGSGWEWRIPKAETFIPPPSDHSSSSGASSQMRASRDVVFRTHRRELPTPGGDGSGQPLVKRKKSSEKEKQRNMEIKRALRTLTKSMPFVNRHKELSRIRTLRLAKEYIVHLRRILDGEMVYCENSGKLRPLLQSDFEHIVERELQTNNSYKDRAEKEIGESRPGPTPIRFESGRDDWFQITLGVDNNSFQLPDTTLDDGLGVGGLCQQSTAMMESVDEKYRHNVTSALAIDSYINTL